MLNNPNTRKWVYVAQTVLGAALVVLVATGLVDQAVSDQITSSVDRIVAGIGGLALLGGGELARRNLSPKPATISADGVQVITDALAAHSTRTQPAIEAAPVPVDPFLRR
ncbi:hypothetical protein [Prescottella equi]